MVRRRCAVVKSQLQLNGTLDNRWVEPYCQRTLPELYDYRLFLRWIQILRTVNDRTRMFEEIMLPEPDGSDFPCVFRSTEPTLLVLCV